MKKAIIVTNKLGDKDGWGRYTSDMTNQLLKNDFDVLVLCYKKNNNYKTIKQLEIFSNPLLLRRNQILVPLYLTLFLLKNNGFGRSEFIHCFVEPYLFFTYLLSKILGVKYFVTIHGSYGIKGFDFFFYKFLQIFSYKRAKKIICISNYTKNKLLKYLKDPKNIKIIPNGVGEMSASEEKMQDQKENIIMGLGGVKFRKGYHITLQALAIVKKDIPDIKYFIVGNLSDTNYVSYLEKIIRDLGLKDNVSMGFLLDDELKKVYKKSKLFVLNSVSSEYDFEGFGLVYLEANSFGLPTIGSYENGGEDAIKDGFNGLLAKAGDVQDTAQKILLVLKDEKLRLKMSKNAREWAKRFDWESIFEKYLEIYYEK